MTIQVDYSQWEAGKDYPEWMNEVSLATISKGYLLPDETPKMAFRRVQNLGTVTASTLGDDAAHSLTGLVISPNSGVRVNEFAGNDVFVKLTLAGTAVTATNGTYIKASTSLIIHPEEKPQNGPGNILLDGTDSSSSNAGDSLTAESGVDSTGKTVLQYNRAEDNFRRLMNDNNEWDLDEVSYQQEYGGIDEPEANFTF